MTEALDFGAASGPEIGCGWVSDRNMALMPACLHDGALKTFTVDAENRLTTGFRG